MITFDKVTFSHGSRTILKSLSFTIQSNERVAILGGSGEGKTTILKLILRLLIPDFGKIIINDKDITNLPERELYKIRKNFSIVFQDGALFDSLSVKENVAFYMREFLSLTEDEINQRVKFLLETVAVSGVENLMPEELSGGMLRRVAIARSLAVQKPDMFLYDEPTSDLDPINAASIRGLITQLTDPEHGFIIVTHELLDAVQLAQRFMFLKNGNFLFDGSIEELRNCNIPEINSFMSQWRHF